MAINKKVCEVTIYTTECDLKYCMETNPNLVEVVRCKECKNRVYDDSRDYYYCSMFYGQGDVSDENFCQWGERKEL